jgi:hypothetical protein
VKRRRESRRLPLGRVTVPRVAYSLMAFAGGWPLAAVIIAEWNTNRGLAMLGMEIPIALLTLFLAWGCWAQGGVHAQNVKTWLGTCLATVVGAEMAGGVGLAVGLGFVTIVPVVWLVSDLRITHEGRR